MKTIYTLHKLSEGFIITSDEEPKINDIVYSMDGIHEWFLLVLTTEPLPLKVIAQQDQIIFNISEEEQKKIGWFDTFKLFNQIDGSCNENEYEHWLFNEGFQKAQELLSDRMFTLEDMRKAFDKGIEFEQSDYKDAYEDYSYNKDVIFDNCIQSLSPTSWQIELEMEECETHRLEECYSRFQCCENPIKPKLTNGKVIITKIL